MNTMTMISKGLPHAQTSCLIHNVAKVQAGLNQICPKCASDDLDKSNENHQRGVDKMVFEKHCSSAMMPERHTGSDFLNYRVQLQGQAAALREYGIRPLTIRNGVDIRTPVSKDNERFTIAFTGSVYQELMDPGILFKCLQQMIHSGDLEVSRLKIIYAGKDGKYWMHKASQYPDVAGCTENFGIVAESAAMNIQDNANINYLSVVGQMPDELSMPAPFLDLLP